MGEQEPDKELSDIAWILLVSIWIFGGILVSYTICKVYGPHLKNREVLEENEIVNVKPYEPVIHMQSV